MPGLAVVVNWIAMFPPGSTLSLAVACVKRRKPVGGVGSINQFAGLLLALVPVTEILPGVPPFAGMATVTLFRLFIFGAIALLTVNVYAVEAPSDAALGLMLAVYATMTVMAGLVSDALVPLVTSVAVSLVVAGAWLSVTSVTLNVPVPNTNAAFEGKCACASVEVI